jgi:ABC-type transporter Mla MlaB component
MSTVGELSEAIAEIVTDGDSLLINLSKCRYFDSSGLAALVRARKVLGAQLTILVDPKSQICRIMHLVGFDTLSNVVTELHTPPRDLGFLEVSDHLGKRPHESINSGGNRRRCWLAHNQHTARTGAARSV